MKWFATNGKSMFWSLFCLIFAAALSYGYFVQSAVVSLVRRGVVEKERGALASYNGESEARYLKEKRSITAAVARAYGFEDTRVARFISAKTVTVLRLGADL